VKARLIRRGDAAGVSLRKMEAELWLEGVGGLGFWDLVWLFMKFMIKPFLISSLYIEKVLKRDISSSAF
jgi:hypothetical protein